MITNEELKNIFDETFAEKVAKDIADLIVQKSDKDNLEVDFHLSEGKMVGSCDNPNTWFKIDCPKDSDLCKAKEIMSEVYGTDFDTSNKEDYDRMNESREICDEFLEKIRTVLNSGLFHKEISNTLRKVALGGVPEFLVPIDVIRFLSIEIGEASEDDYLLTIQKKTIADPVTGQWLQPPQSVNADLFETHKNTGMSFSDIVQLRKAQCDPRYDLVTGVTQKRYSFELHCDIAANYSFCEPTTHARATI